MKKDYLDKCKEKEVKIDFKYSDIASKIDKEKYINVSNKRPFNYKRFSLIGGLVAFSVIVISLANIFIQSSYKTNNKTDSTKFQNTEQQNSNLNIGEKTSNDSFPGVDVNDRNIIEKYYSNHLNNIQSSDVTSEPELDWSIESVMIENPIALKKIKYLYETETSLDLSNIYCAYIEKEYAQRMITEINGKGICGGLGAPYSLDEGNGNIVEWFYTETYYQEDKISWQIYHDFESIKTEDNDSKCLGVYAVSTTKFKDGLNIKLNDIVEIKNIFSISFNTIDDHLQPKDNNIKELKLNWIGFNEDMTTITTIDKEEIYGKYSDFGFKIATIFDSDNIKVIEVKTQYPNYSNLELDDKLEKFYDSLQDIIMDNNEVKYRYVTFRYEDFIEAIKSYFAS